MLIKKIQIFENLNLITTFFYKFDYSHLIYSNITIS